MSSSSTPPPSGRSLDDVFQTSTPPSSSRNRKNLSASSTTSSSKRRASLALSDSPSKKRDFIEYHRDYVSPTKLVPMVSRAEAVAAQVSEDIGNDSDSGDEVFEDAAESFGEQQGLMNQDLAMEEAKNFFEKQAVANGDFPMEGAQNFFEQDDQATGDSWGFEAVDEPNADAETNMTQQAADLVALGIPSQEVESTEQAEETNENEDEDEGLASKYFSRKPTSPEDSDDDSLILVNSTKRRISTPPLPNPNKPTSTTKPLQTQRKPRKDPKWAPRERPGPDTRLDISPFLLAHSRFHFRASDLIPRLTNHPLFHPSPPRRYWIAVLLPNKLAKNVSSEKDFIWMKGNKFSTVKTVWTTYLNTTFAEPEEWVLMLGVERVEMGTTMAELNYWDDNVVVFRVVKGVVDGKRNPDVKGRSLVEGLERWPVEVIELDDD